MNCRLCGSSDLIRVLSLGNQPLANNFLRPEDFEKEKAYPLELVYCRECTLVQLSKESFVPREVIFSNYYYASSVAGGLRSHFERLAAMLVNRFGLSASNLVVDIGSNDGVLLRPLKQLGIRAIGVESAENLARIANEAGLTTVNEFFNSRTTERIKSQYGAADVVLAANVFAHLEDVHGFIESVKALLKKSGVFIVEIQYLANTIMDLTFDNIYHEHIFYYTLRSLSRLFAKHNMTIFDVEKIPTHGGSLRVYVTEGDREIGGSIASVARDEENMSLHREDTYLRFASEVRKRLRQIVDLLTEISGKGEVIAGYGAPAKSSTLLNSLTLEGKRLDDTIIRYIIEDNILKQGLYTPGTHIPITNPGTLDEQPPTYLLILAWNYAEEIMRKCESYRGKNGKFIVPMPQLAVSA